jgi:LysM repeat protein
MRKRQISLLSCLIIFCLAFLLASPLHAAERYRVKPGDSLHKIAKKHHVSVAALREANSLDGDALRPNQTLVIPGGKSPKKAPTQKIAKKSQPDAAVYVVKKGDTLSRVAESTGVPTAEIREINGLHSSKLKSGQKLFLQKAPAKGEEAGEDLEEEGSIEAGEFAAGSEDRDREDGVAPIELSRWKEAGERDLFVRVVKSYEGVPYKLGGNSMRGIDCSAFTKKVYGVFSIDLPRTAREQLQRGKRVGRDELDTGDLVFFQTRRNRIHVGIFLGGSEFFHLSSRNRAGKVDNIESAYFSSRFLRGVRLIEKEQAQKAEKTAVPLKPEEGQTPVSLRQVPRPPEG